MKQKEIAEKLQYSQVHVHRILKGYSSLKTIFEISQHVKADFLELYDMSPAQRRVYLMEKDNYN